MNKQINTILPDIHLVHDIAKTTSKDVAEKFEKKHKNVLQSIQNLDIPEEFSRLNFQPSEYKDSRGKMMPMYEMTRDGFVLLAMGFTGRKAMEWKIAYINAFNLLEAQALASKDTRMIEMQEQLLIRQDQLIGNMMKLQIKGTLVTPDEKAHIRLLFSKGLSKAEIGRRTGRGRDTVRSIIKASPQVH